MKLQKLEKDERKWKVTEFINDKIRVFRDTVPLITDLRDESMRERHWKELRIEVKEDFDETDASFTLEKCFDPQLINHIEKISDLTMNAKKQLKIEKALKEIKRMWEDDKATELEMDRPRSRADNEEFYKITSTENIISLIEDHSQQLATMKSSPYYKQFDDKIDMWENNINKITETLDLLMQV
jgi:dynein heavy chain